MSIKPSWACKNWQPYTQHQSKAYELNRIVMHFEYVPTIIWEILSPLSPSAHGILPWYDSMFHYEYVIRLVILEADIPLQQLSTDQMSISRMKICYIKKDESMLFACYNVYVCDFAEFYLVILEQLFVKPWPMLIILKKSSHYASSLHEEHLPYYQDRSSIEECWRHHESVNNDKILDLIQGHSGIMTALFS